MNSQIDPRPKKLFALVEKIKQARQEGLLLVQAGDTGYGQAPSNIALLKYWGKASERCQIPVSSSLSRNLDGFVSKTRVVAKSRMFPFEERFTAPVSFQNHSLSLNQIFVHDLPQKMKNFLDLFLQDWAVDVFVHIESENNFPTGCGVASSASGYAALVLALSEMAGIGSHLSEAEMNIWLTEWARLGSGSATRSALPVAEPSAFVAWDVHFGDDNQNIEACESKTYEVKVDPVFRSMKHLLFSVSENEKKISSSDGHRFASSSIFQTIRVAGLSEKFTALKGALAQGYFEKVQQICEEDALLMHAVMATSEKPVYYMTEQTVRVIEEFLKGRQKWGWKAIWTLDAGPNVHFLVTPEDAASLADFLAGLAIAGSRLLSGDSHDDSLYVSQFDLECESRVESLSESTGFEIKQSSATWGSV